MDSQFPPQLPEGTSAIPFVESPTFEPTQAPDDIAAPTLGGFQPSVPVMLSAPSMEEEDTQSPPLSPSQHQSPTSPPHSGSEAPAEVVVEPPTNEAKYAAVTEAQRRQIASRTAAMDASTKEKEAQTVAAAKAYIKNEQTKREKHLETAKASHKKDQQESGKKIDAYKKSGAVWNAVGMLVDLNKPNSYSKGTERMRSLLNTLNETQKSTVK